MKQTIRLTESELKGLIKDIIVETEVAPNAPQVGVWQKMPEGVRPETFLRYLTKTYGGEYEYDPNSKKYRKKKPQMLREKR